MNAFNIIESDDGLSYRVEWDMHYITDEQADTIRAYIESLQAENEKLRKERDALDRLTDVLNATNDGLLAENAKLRELVRDLWLQLLNAYDRKEVDEFADRMRELGVEV